MSTRSRRSSRKRGQADPIIAPGFGTKKDLEKLSKDLSDGSATKLPVEAVEAMMNSRGRGIETRSSAADEVKTAGATSSAWADFMKEEGVEHVLGSGPKETKTEPSESRREKKSTKKSTGSRKYSLESLTKEKEEEGGGSLLQAGTLDASVVGRKIGSIKGGKYHLQVPTRILPKILITKVFTSCNSVHCIALDRAGQPYGWGRNDQGQLGQSLGKNVALPTLLEGLPLPIQAAATGKNHTLFLNGKQEVYSLGFNKVGQCGVKSSVETVSNPRQCAFVGETPKIVQISCGEDFSMALSSEGIIYSAGSSEFGQLGNGETGEYFVTASKLAFENCNIFTPRRTFMQQDPSQEVNNLSTNPAKMVKIEEDIRIQYIACGKHHTIAVEAASTDSDDRIRVFSWGCGDYGCLGHGVQADEYSPRVIGAIGTSVWLPPGLISVSAGAHCSLLQTSNGHVYYWGKHRTIGDATMRPQLVDALANNQHVVSHSAAGGQTVVCCTEGHQTVAWGQGPHGELGFSDAKSSSKPQFVKTLTGCRIVSLACGYGCTVFVVKDEDEQDKEAIEKLDQVVEDDIAELEEIWATAKPPSTKSGKPGKPSKRRKL